MKMNENIFMKMNENVLIIILSFVKNALLCYNM